MERLELSRLALSNWKSHLKTEIVFSLGNNVLIGAMGAGKSSIVSAIVFALFGELPETRTRRAKLDDLIYEVADTAEIALDFIVGGRKHSIIRRIKRGGGSTLSELRDGNGKLLEGPMSEKVTAQAERVIGADYSLFNRAIYLEQNEIDSFLWEGKGKRREGIDGILGIGKVEDARKTLLSIIAGLRAEAESRSQEDYPKKIGALERALADNEKERSEKADELERAAGRAERTSELLSEKRELIARLENSRDSLRKASERERIFSDKAREISKKLDNYGKIGDAKSGETLRLLETERKGLEKTLQEISSVQGRLSEKENRRVSLKEALSKSTISGRGVDALSKELEDSTREALSISASLAVITEGILSSRRAEARIANLKIPLSKISGATLREEGARKRLEEISSKLSALTAELDELGTSAKALRLHSKEVHQFPCPVCESPLDSARTAALLSEKESKISEKSALAGKLLDEKARAEIELKKILADSKEENQISHEIALLSEEAGKLRFLEESLREGQARERTAKERVRGIELAIRTEREHAVISKELSETERGIGKELEKLAVLEEASRGRTLESIDAKISEARALNEGYCLFLEKKVALENAQTARLEIERFSKEFNEEEFFREKGALEALSKEKGMLEEMQRRLPEELAKCDKRNAELTEEILSEKRKAERKELVSKALEFSKALDSALKEAMAELRTELVLEINGTLSQYWQVLYPYSNYSDIRLVSRENDYVLELKTGLFGAWVEAERVASGGEKSLACLALRIAFARTLAPGFGLLLLDEPTHNLDSNAVNLLASVFRERVSAIAPQTILITHDESLEGAATGNCYRIARDGAGTSEITQLS